MAIKQQNKVGKPAGKTKPPAAKRTAPKKTASIRKTARTSATKVKTAKAPAAPKKQAKTSKPVSRTTPKALPAKPATKSPATKTAKPAVKKVMDSGAKPSALKETRFDKKDLAQFKIELLAMRERITGQSGAMRNAALQRNDEVNLEEEGTDAFMRLQTLTQVGTQQQIVASIDEALRAIDHKTYGVCDMCGVLISKSRLKSLPFAKNCIKCQSEIEQKHYQVGRR